jgi:hypothetical protein
VVSEESTPAVAVAGHESAEHRGRVSRGEGPLSRIGAARESSQDDGPFASETLDTLRPCSI